jgi:inhibitor of the pro-sigma K processing machinery
MLLGISYGTLVAYLFVLILIIILLTILATPIKWLIKVLISSGVGAIALIAFNFISHYIGFSIGINPASILTIGILGIPGFILLIFLKLYLF